MTLTITKLMTIMMTKMVLIQTCLILHLDVDVFRLSLTTLLDFNFTVSLLYKLLTLWQVLFHVLHTATYT